LQPELQRYDLVLPETVIRPDGQRLELSPPPEWSAQTTFGPVHRGVLFSVDHLVAAPKEKRTLGEKSGALAVDMESFAVVEVCQRRGTPVLAVRIIIDRLEEELPPEVRGLLKQKTTAARLGAALGALWNRPSSWKDLYRLKEQALLASDRLARFLAWAIGEVR
jgi:adenosylhomocysteine nucleosidase